MGSKTLWLTDLGLVEIGSGELSPGLVPIEIRYYPQYGHGIDEWEFTVNVDMVKSLEKVEFNDDERYFTLRCTFDEFVKGTYLTIHTTHVRTGLRKSIWDGLIIPNKLQIVNDNKGLSTNWDIISDLTEMYPNLNLCHYVLPTIDVVIKSNVIIASKALSVFEHVEDNAPIIIRGFHPDQVFNVLVEGHVFGYGGMGGCAGMSTVTNEVDVLYPTDGLNGGNPIFVEHDTQQVSIVVSQYGHYHVGEGGKGASSFVINDSKRRINQLGVAGVGGYPTGRNGEHTDVHYRIKAVKSSVHADFAMFGHDHYGVQDAFIDTILVQEHPTNTSIKKTEDGMCGSYTPKGVVELKNHGRITKVTSLCYAYGSYVVF